mgnify:CR=1 FL=1
MLDSTLRPLIDPPLNYLGARLSKAGVTANMVTVAGFFIGLLSVPALALGHPLIALIAIGLNRLSDGLDGAVARHSHPTDAGGYLDIVFDFIFYSAVPFGFALMAPQENALAAAFLIFSFVGTGCSFLAYAIIAAKRGLSTEIRGRKSFYYLGGLTEGAETIALLFAICLLPDWFPILAYVFGGLCWVTTASRIWAGWGTFRH